MRRGWIEKRINFTKEEREAVLNKTDCKCARCGMALDTETLTIDHFIPLSKGGSNMASNLIPLCEECNQIKDNAVMHPRDYIKYLKDTHKKEIESLYNWYCEDYKWYDRNNYTIEDRMIIPYPIYLQSSRSHKKKENRPVLYVGNAILEKLDYSMLDEAYEFTLRYMKRLKLNTSNLKNTMSDIFARGCIYRIRNNSGLIAVIPIQIDKTDDYKKPFYFYSFAGIPILYNKPEYRSIVRKALVYILGNLSRLASNHTAAYRFAVPEEDLFLLKTVIPFADTFYHNSNENWLDVVGHYTFDTLNELEINGHFRDKEKDEKGEYNTFLSKMAKREDAFISAALENSPILERLFDLPPINKEENNFDIRKRGTVDEKKATRQYRKKQRLPESMVKSNKQYKRTKSELKYGDEEYDIRNYI